jgi:hypothetical protein
MELSAFGLVLAAGMEGSISNSPASPATRAKKSAKSNDSVVDFTLVVVGVVGLEVVVDLVVVLAVVVVVVGLVVDEDDDMGSVLVRRLLLLTLFPPREDPPVLIVYSGSLQVVKGGRVVLILDRVRMPFLLARTLFNGM